MKRNTRLNSYGQKALCVIFMLAAAWAAVSSVMAEDLYFCPNADGKGATNWKDSSSNHGWYIGRGNLTNAQGAGSA